MDNQATVNVLVTAIADIRDQIGAMLLRLAALEKAAASSAAIVVNTSLLSGSTATK